MGFLKISLESNPLPWGLEGLVASFRKVSLSLWVLTGLVLIFAAQEIFWLWHDQRPPRWDESGHLIVALHFADALRESPIAFIRAFICDEHYYPPFIPAVGAFFSFFSHSPNFITGSMTLFGSLLILSVYAIARRYFGPEAAVAASAMLMSYPLLVGQAHYFMLDVPLTAFAALAFWALDRAEGFDHRIASSVFGILCGFGLLVKWTFFIFMIVPIALACLQLGNADIRTRYRNQWSALFFASLVAGPWYLWNSINLVSGFWTFGIKQGAIEGMPRFLSTQALLFYPQVLWGTLSFFGSLLFAVGCWHVFREKKHRVLVWTIIFSIIIFALLPNKKDRYIMPALPFAAILSVAWIPRLEVRGRKTASAVLTLGALAVLGAPFLTKGGSDLRPDSADWKVETLLSHIPKGTTSYLSVIPDHAYLNVANCSYFSHAFFPWVQPIGIFNFPLFADYALVRTGDQGPAFMTPEKRQQLTSDLLDKRSPTGKLFEQVCSESLPDGSTAVLLHRRDDLRISDVAFRSGVLRLLDQYLRNPKGFRLSVASENEGSKELKISFREGYLGDYAHKPDALRMRNMNLLIRGIRINPNTLTTSKVQLLSVGSLEVTSAEVDQTDLEDFARPFAKGISDLHVHFEGGQVNVTGRYGKIPIQIAVTLFNPSPTDANVYFRVEKVKIGFFRLPSVLVNFLLKDKNPLIHKINTPMAVNFGEIRIDNGVLQIRD